MDIDEPDRLAVAGCNVEEPLKLQASPWSKGCAPAVPSRSASFALNTHPIPELPGRASTQISAEPAHLPVPSFCCWLMAAGDWLA